MKISLPYGKGKMTEDVPSSRVKGIIQADSETVLAGSYEVSEEDLVENSLLNPIDSKRLSELAVGKKNIVVISSDHTRPVPSKIIMPKIIEEIRRGNPSAKITILVATGTHRLTTHDELVDKYGQDIVSKINIVVHDSDDEKNMVAIGTLPSGANCRINRVAAEADLLVAEGFIEPHFFAGYSGGRKAVFPGVAARTSVFGNHNGQFIDSKFSRTGILEHNPIHKDMVEAARLAKLKFIINVVLDHDKRIVGSFAGDSVNAHLKGTKFVDSVMEADPIYTDVTITSNGGYPLDQNMYQMVKGMTGAESTNKKDGVIIIAGRMNDGTGGDKFFRLFKDCDKVSDIYNDAVQTPAEKTEQDQWQAQILARVMINHHVIVVTDKSNAEMVEDMKMTYADSIKKALEIADEIVGSDSSIGVLPDGVSTIIKK
ncbi:nickel-dependent lactate racemase [Ligilactobacillus acidipiscis]|uniref:nickel-dependent lactate racemase n=1 Tax=Ligilactobacillus acidipiscis TaxID=89059 RepID=UPI0023F664F3|nr:nickel-dependent lactate racemase [Ligilactobacillus acidipiscis]WEV57518.1 nickel-dependent lactate racemase [Ligilactobacillus acidipiscis]